MKVWRGGWRPHYSNAAINVRAQCQYKCAEKTKSNYGTVIILT